MSETADLQAENAHLREELEAVYEAWEYYTCAWDHFVCTKENKNHEWISRNGDQITCSESYPTRREAIMAYVATRKEMTK